jgi:CHAT domain-containing protein
LRLSLGASLSRKPPKETTAGTTYDPVSYNHLANLYRELVQPIARLISGDRLILVPHGSLFYLPFHAFRDEDQFLSDRYAISYAPSATAYYLARLKSRTRREAAPTVAVASSDTDETLSGLTDLLLHSIEGSARVSGGSDGRAWANRTRGASYAHIVTRAHLRQDNPMFSTMSLGNDRIHLFDLFQWRLDLELITISGWAPGLQASAKGNEVVGLVRGLLYAGARSVLTSLWDVDDSTWASFSRHFYRAINESQSKQSALQVATSALRRETRDPRHWAPFLLFGDTD